MFRIGGRQHGFGIINPSNRSDISLEFTDSEMDTVDKAAFTHTMAIGEATTDRLVVVAVAGENNFTTLAISSITIGGSTPTLINTTTVGESGIPSAIRVSLYQQLISSGTTTDVVVTYNTSCFRSFCATWSLKGYSSATAQTSGTDLADVLSVNLSNLGSNSVVIAPCIAGNTGNFSFSGVTSNTDIDDGTNGTFGAGSILVESPANPYNVESDFSGVPLTEAMVVAAWR